MESAQLKATYNLSYDMTADGIWSLGGYLLERKQYAFPNSDDTRKRLGSFTGTSNELLCLVHIAASKVKSYNYTLILD